MDFSMRNASRIIEGSGAEDVELSDECIVERVRNGEAEAFEALVKRWEDRIYRLAMRLLGHPEDAREVTQETFLAAFRKLHQFRGRARFSSWLYRIALNCCYDRLRERRVEPLPLEEADGVTTEERVLGQIHRKQVAERVRRAVHALPIEMRQVLILKEYEGLTFEEIAEILDIPVSTAKTRLYAGLDHLRKRLEWLKDAL
ncbi:MAG: sigma-70 family RNA polymerase sigma factor [Blastocatellia bacterium]|nr:sigma-70 family RNA polymerase sigma factor [Blastocatellia bacterium]